MEGRDDISSMVAKTKLDVPGHVQLVLSTLQFKIATRPVLESEEHFKVPTQLLSMSRIFVQGQKKNSYPTPKFIIL